MSIVQNLLTDYTKDNLTKLIYDKIYSKNYEKKFNYQKINVYNTHIDSALQKIWIKIPKVKIARSISHPSEKFNNHIPMYLILYQNNDTIKKLYSFIKKLERKIANYIRNESKKKIIIKSSICTSDTFPPIMNINLPFQKIGKCYEFNLNIYDQYNQRINAEYIKSGNYASVFVELNSVWINDKNIGFNWDALQIKIYPEFDFTRCLFYDETDKTDNIDNNKIDIENNNDQCYHCLYCPNNRMRTHCCNLLNNTQNCYDLSNTHSMRNLDNMKNLDNIKNTSNSYKISNSSNIPLPPPILNSKIIQNKGENKSGFVPSIKDLLSVKLKKVNRELNNENKDKDNHPDETTESFNKLLSIKKNLKKVNDNITNEKSNINKKDMEYLSDLLDNIVADMEFEKFIDNDGKIDQEHKKLLNFT